MFLMPSAFEPCGLGQLISLRYGTIPVVRSTGGLRDTVIEYNPDTGSGNGFSFAPYDSSALLAAIDRGLELYDSPRAWQSLVKRAMQEDHSWNRSAAEYMGLYKTPLPPISRANRLGRMAHPRHPFFYAGRRGPSQVFPRFASIGFTGEFRPIFGRRFEEGGEYILLQLKISGRLP